MVTAMTRDVSSSEEQAMHELAEAYSGLRARYQERYHGHLPSDIAEATDPESEVGRVYTEINREVVARQGRLLRQPRAMQQALLDWHRRLRHGRHAPACTSSTNSSSNNNNNNRSGGFRGGAVVGGSAFYGTEDLSLRVWLEGVFVYYRRRLRRHLPEQLVSSLLLLPLPGVEAMGSFETVGAEGPQLARGVGDAVRCARQLGWASLGQLEDALRVLLDLMRSFDVMQQMVAIFTEGTTSTSNSSSSTSASNGVRAAARMTSIATTTMSVCCRVLSAQLNRPGDFALLLVLFVSCILAYQDMLEAQVREYARREVTREEAAKTTMTRSTAEVCEPYGTPATTTRTGPEEGGQAAQPHIRTDVERMKTLSRGLRCLYRIFGLCLSPFHHNATTILTLLLLRCTAATSRTAALCASHVSNSHSNDNTTEHSEKGNGVHAEKEAEEKDETRRSNGMSLPPVAPLTESAWRCRADVQLVTTVLPLYLHGMAHFLSCDTGVEAFVMAVLLHPLYNTNTNSNSNSKEEDYSNDDTTRNGGGGISLGVNDDSSSSKHHSREEKSRNAEGEERHERQGSTSETPQRPAPPASQAHSHRPSLPSASASLVYYGASDYVNDDAAATVDTTCVPSRRLLTALFYRTLRPVMGQILRAAHAQSNTESNSNNHTHGTTTSSSSFAQAECSTARTAHGRDDEAACDMSATRQIREAQDMLVCVAHVAVYLCVPEQPRVNWWPSVGLGPPQQEEAMMMNATEEEKRRWGGRAIGVSCFTEAMRLAVREMMEAVLAQLRISPASNGGGEADHCAAALPLLLPRPAAPAAAGVEAGSTQNNKNSSTTTMSTSKGGGVSHITAAAAAATARVEHACLTEAQLLAFYRTLLACGPAFYAVSEQAAELCGAYERTRRSAAEEDEATTRDTRTKPQTDLMAFLWESDTNARRAQNLLQDCASLFTSEGPALLLAMSPGESATTLATLLVNSLHHYILVHSDAELAELAMSEKEKTKKEGEEHHDSGDGHAAAGAASLPSLPHTRSQYTNATTTASTSTSAGVPSRAAIVPLRDEDALRAALRFLACLPSPRSFYTPYTDLCRRRLLSPAWGPRLSERAVRQCRQRWERHVHSALVALYGPSPELQLLHHLIADLDVDDAQPGEDMKVGGGVRQEGSDAACRGSAHASQPPPSSFLLPPSLQTQQQQQEEEGEQGVAAQNGRNEDDEQKAAMALRVYVLNYRWWGYRKEAHLPDSALLAANTRREREAQRGEGQDVPRAFIPSEHTDMVLWPSSSSSSTTTAAAAAGVKMNESTHAAGQTTTKTAATTTAVGPSLSSSAGTSEACGDTMVDPLPFPRDLQAKLREYSAQYAQHHTRTRLCWRQAAECYTTFTLTLRRRRRGGGQCHRTAQDAACKKQSKEEGREEEDAAAGGSGDDVLVQITMHGTLLLQQLYLAIAQYGRRGVSYRTLAARAGGMSVAGLAQLLRRHSEKFRLLVQLPPSLPSSSSLLAAAHTDSSSEAYMNNNNNRKAVTGIDGGGGSDVGAQRVALNVGYLLQLQQEQEEEDREGGGQAAGGVREFTHLPPRVLCLPLLSLGQSEERERLRQHRLQIALVQLLKRAQTMSADALFAAVRERLAESALSRVAFKRGVETLIEGGLVERVNADAVVAAYRYVA